MAEKPLYQAFTLVSPWRGKFRYYVDDARYYRQAMDQAAEIFQRYPIREIHCSTYEMAYREACRQAEKS